MAAFSRGSEAIPSLNGIRALAVGLVFLAHSGLEAWVPGGLGVTIFFVLSGFLITTLMRMEAAATGDVSLRDFYLRRCLRLMPPLVLIVALAGVLSSLSMVEGRFSLQGLLSVLLYMSNYFIIAHDFDGVPRGIGVTWSLAVEEHYYFLYPPLVLLLLRLGRLRQAAWILALLCLLVLAWRTWLALAGASEAHLTMATDTRVDAILAGCVMALWRNPWLERPVANQRGERALAVLCLALLAWTLVYRNETFRLTARYTVQSLAIAPLIYLAVARAQQAPWRWLNTRPMVYLGNISYTVYLTHQLIFYVVRLHWPQLGWLAGAAVTAILTLALAAPMRRLVEEPCARLRRRLHRTPAPGAAVVPIEVGVR